MRSFITACSIGLAFATTANAQQLRGVVRDSATQTPLGGVVVTLMDGTGRTLARAISNERGAYSAGPTAGARTVRALRIGFRPRTVPFPEGATLDLTMTPIPPLLEPVTVRAGANCPARSDRLQALSLLQQARAGLLATVTARQTNRASLVRLRFIRDYDDRGKRIVEQRVTVDSTGGLSESFGAARSGAAFVAEGFVDRKTMNGVPIHYGPDAETLLDDDFAAGYCFQIADRGRARPNEIGLAFKPASRRNGRVDIDGALWIDTVEKSLHDIQFEYVGDVRGMGEPQTGGQIEFRAMKNGIVIIDRWALRLSAGRIDSTPAGNGRVAYHIQEVGGEVARAIWDDGFSWDAPLGTLRALAIDYRNVIARGIVVRLKNTDYIASPSERGILEIPHLLPGPYLAMVVDSATTRLGIALPTSLAFEAERDSTAQRSFTVPRSEEYVLGKCLSGLADNAEPEPLPIRVIDAFGKRVIGAVVGIERHDDAIDRAVTESLDTDETGTARSCLLYRGGDEFDVTVTYGNLPPFTGHFRYGDKAITIRLKDRSR